MPWASEGETPSSDGELTLRFAQTLLFRFSSEEDVGL